MNQKTKIGWKLRWINEYRNKESYDFHITPVLTYCKSVITNEFGSGIAKGIAIEWGHWAVSLLRYKLKFNQNN